MGGGRGEGLRAALQDLVHFLKSPPSFVLFLYHKIFSNKRAETVAQRSSACLAYVRFGGSVPSPSPKKQANKTSISPILHNSFYFQCCVFLHIPTRLLSV